MLVCQLPTVRGIPRNATRLSDAEVAAIVHRCQGNWKINEAVNNQVLHTVPLTDAFFNGTTLVISGARYQDDLYSQHRVARAHVQEQTLEVMHRDEAGVLYVDFLGSIFENFAPESGEIRMNNAMGVEIVMERDWRGGALRQAMGFAGRGRAPPGMIQMPVAHAPPVLAPPVYKEREDDPAALVVANPVTAASACNGCGAQTIGPGAQFCSACGKQQSQGEANT